MGYFFMSFLVDPKIGIGRDCHWGQWLLSLLIAFMSHYRGKMGSYSFPPPGDRGLRVAFRFHAGHRALRDPWAWWAEWRIGMCLQALIGPLSW